MARTAQRTTVTEATYRNMTEMAEQAIFASLHENGPQSIDGILNYVIDESDSEMGLPSVQFMAKILDTLVTLGLVYRSADYEQYQLTAPGKRFYEHIESKLHPLGSYKRSQYTGANS